MKVEWRRLLTMLKLVVVGKELEMPVSTLTSKGQITIPKSIRDRFELEVGCIVEFIVDDEGRIVLRPRREDAADSVFGLLRAFAREERISVDDMKRVVRARAGKK